MKYLMQTPLTVLFFLLVPAISFINEKPGQQEESTSIIFETDFEGKSEEQQENWEFLDDGWKFASADDNGVLSLHKKKSDYSPPHRSPLHIALLKEHSVGSFELNVRCKSTHEDYGHRDLCLFFGYQDDTRFYYVHLGKKMDDHANQIFIVNKADRTKISTTTSDGIPWDDEWHDVRIVRDANSGSIKVYFDDMEKPVMEANDKTFGSGRIGLGSFDDTGDWDDFSLSELSPDKSKP